MSGERLLERSGAPGLAWELHATTAAPRGAVLLTHGYGEHSGRYSEVVGGWIDRGLAVATYDLRGHGHSEGRRGHIDSFRDYVRDAEDLLDTLDREQGWKQAGKPVLFGHSLGGLIATYVALARQARYRGLALTSPFLGLALEVSPLQRLLGHVASRLAPRFAQSAKLLGADMTHDPEIAAAYDADPLGIRHVTARWFTEVTGAQRDLLAAAPHLRLPLYCVAAGADRVVSLEATRRFVELAGSPEKQLRVLPDLYHEVLNELDRKALIVDLAERMLRWTSA